MQLKCIAESERMSYIGPGGHLLKCTVCLSEPLLHAQMALAKEENY